jgi:UDP-2-acetamido-3-amino-2,3-dideoxy-glucuronate N-acetyltransferase
MKVPPQISASAEIHPSVILGEGTKIWHAAQIREGVQMGSNCNVGSMTYVGPNVKIGNNVKIQNLSLIYDPCVLGDGVFIGPNVVITNDKFPRAVNSDFSLKSHNDWNPVGVEICDGASIGAGAICVAPLVVGRWSMVAAGAVVTKDVPSFGLVAGVPAKRIGWVGPAGVPLITTDQVNFKCPISGREFEQVAENELRAREI